LDFWLGLWFLLCRASLSFGWLRSMRTLGGIVSLSLVATTRKRVRGGMSLAFEAASTCRLLPVEAPSDRGTHERRLSCR
jgi:hypothetical protein